MIRHQGKAGRWFRRLVSRWRGHQMCRAVLSWWVRSGPDRQWHQGTRLVPDAYCARCTYVAPVDISPSTSAESTYVDDVQLRPELRTEDSSFNSD